MGIRVHTCILISKQNIIWESCLSDDWRRGRRGRRELEKGKNRLDIIKWSYLVFNGALEYAVATASFFQKSPTVPENKGARSSQVVHSTGNPCYLCGAGHSVAAHLGGMSVCV